MADEPNVQDPAEGSDNPERPSWLPENFKDEEAFATSYKELQRKLTEESTARSALEQNYGELTAQVERIQSQQTQQSQVGAADPYIAAYETAMENGDYKTALGIQTQLAQMAAQATVQSALPQVQQQYQTVEDATSNQIAAYAAFQLESQYGEAFMNEDTRRAMGELIAKSPHLIPEEAKFNVDVARQSLDNVFKLATFGKNTAAQTSSSATAEMKTLAQTASGAGGRAVSPDEAKAEWDAIKAANPTTYY